MTMDSIKLPLRVSTIKLNCQKNSFKILSSIGAYTSRCKHVCIIPFPKCIYWYRDSQQIQ